MSQDLLVVVALGALVVALTAMTAFLVVVKAARKARLTSREVAAEEILPRVLVLLHSEFWALPEVFGRRGQDAERLAADLLPKLMGDDRQRLADALDQSGVIDRAGRHLRSCRAVRRHCAADLLGAAGSRRYVPALTRCLWDRDGEVRTAAARGLGQVGDPLAAGDLLTALADGRVSPNTVSMTLRRIGPGASEALLGALHAGPIPVKAVAAELVGAFGLKGASATLVHLLDVDLTVVERTDIDIRPSAASALGRLGLREHVPRLIDELKAQLTRPAPRRDMDYAVELVAALGRIGDERARPVLEHSLATPRRPSAVSAMALEASPRCR